MLAGLPFVPAALKEAKAAPATLPEPAEPVWMVRSPGFGWSTPTNFWIGTTQDGRGIIWRYMPSGGRDDYRGMDIGPHIERHYIALDAPND